MERAKIRTCLVLNGKVGEAVEFYTSLFRNSRIERTVAGPGEGAGPMVIEFTLAGTPYLALDAPIETTPTYAVSISVLTEDQAETDHLWARLTEDGEGGHCGWLRDRYGFSWQIVPERLPELMSSPDDAARGRVQQALMGMGKIDIAALERAHDNKVAA